MPIFSKSTEKRYKTESESLINTNLETGLLPLA